MTTKDINILAKKIVVGIIVYLIPVQIIFGGLWFTNYLLKQNTSIKKTAVYPVRKPN